MKFFINNNYILILYNILNAFYEANHILNVERQYSLKL